MKKLKCTKIQRITSFSIVKYNIPTVPEGGPPMPPPDHSWGGPPPDFSCFLARCLLVMFGRISNRILKFVWGIIFTKNRRNNCSSAAWRGSTKMHRKKNVIWGASNLLLISKNTTPSKQKYYSWQAEMLLLVSQNAILGNQRGCKIYLLHRAPQGHRGP